MSAAESLVMRLHIAVTPSRPARTNVPMLPTMLYSEILASQPTNAGVQHRVPPPPPERAVAVCGIIIVVFGKRRRFWLRVGEKHTFGIVRGDQRRCCDDQRSLSRCYALPLRCVAHDSRHGCPTLL